MPPFVLLAIQLVQLAVKYAPEAEKAYENAKRLFEMWFAGGLITIEQQAALHDWADQHQAATLRGEVPPALLVEPDPT